MSDGVEAIERARQTVEQLIGLFGTDRSEFANRVSALDTPTDLGVAAHVTANDAIDAGDFHRAEAALSIEQAANQELDDLAAVVDVGIRIAGVKKVIATDVPSYEIARDYALGMAGLARKMKRTPSRFAGLAVAADSAYFAAQTLEENREFVKYNEWLLTTLSDAVEAIELLPAATPSSGSGFLNMLLATVQQVMRVPFFDSEDQPDRTTVTASLRHIALALETFIEPQSHVGSASPDSSLDTEILAQLSYQHGSPDNAFERISGVIERAAAAGNLVSYMEASASRYEGERGSARPSARMRALRRDYQAGIEGVRRTKRSRAGRMQIAELLDRSIGSMVTDEFADEVAPDSAAAFDATEINKARCLLDEMNGVVRSIDDPVVAKKALNAETQLLHLEASQRTTPASDEFQLLSRLPFGGLQPGSGDVAQLDQLERTYSHAGGGFVDSAAITNLADVSSALAEAETLVSYHIPYDPLDPGGTLLIMWITRDRTLTLHLPLIYEGDLGFIGRIQTDGQQPLDSGPLMNLIAMTRRGIRDGRDALLDADLKQLYRILIAPLEDYGFSPAEFSRIIIVPPGVLNAVPFAALRNPDGRFLIELAPLVVAPSSSVWEHLTRRQAQMPAPATFLAFGNPQMPVGWEQLPGAEREITRIVDELRGFDTDVRIAAEATESAFLRDSPGKHFIHLATHGEFPENDAVDMHRVVLAGDDDQDGFLNAEEIRRSDLTKAQLVVLSICDGALIRFGPGDEPLGLLSAFFAAGATNIVAPLWEIDDSAASDWMAEFYRSLLDSGPARALQQACIERARRGAPIRDWAGFALFGVGRTFVNGADSTSD